MKILYAFTAAAAIAAAAAIGFAYSGLYDASARTTHWGLTHWLLSTTSHRSIERRAAGISPPDLDDPALARAGVNDFNAMCSGCHGAPGQAPAPMGQGMNPPPPDLSESARHMSAAELFWVTKNGIRMTGMPAWGVTHDDAELWPVVAFMKLLPELDEDGYQALLAAAEGMGHHAAHAAGGEHAHTGDGVPTAHAHDHHDHADHMHSNHLDGEDHAESPQATPEPAGAEHDHGSNHAHDHQH